MKIKIIFPAFLLAVLQCIGQGLFERLTVRTDQSIHIFGCNGSPDKIVSAGTAALYFVPTDPTSKSGVPVIITAYHNLCFPGTTNQLPQILVKLNSSPNANRAQYLSIKLKHDMPRNYWRSEQGYDLALIPFPREMVDSNLYPMFSESELLTPEKAKEFSVSPGLIVYTVCHQPEYFDNQDFILPSASPIVRVGHLSRLAWEWLPQSNILHRVHVIDMHSSPGNSGATVILNVITEDSKVRRSFFLGIVQGFYEEMGSYRNVKAPISNISTSTLQLTSADQSTTNLVALTVKTVANPNLTTVVPVSELKDVFKTQQFQSCVTTMLNAKGFYMVMYGPSIIKDSTSN